MLKQLAEVFESDKKSKLSAEFPEVGPSGASAYLGQAGGDYDRAREMLVAVYQRFKERVGFHSCYACLYACYTLLLLPATFLSRHQQPCVILASSHLQSPLAKAHPVICYVISGGLLL